VALRSSVGVLGAAYMGALIGWDDPSAGGDGPGAVRMYFCMGVSVAKEGKLP
jgi:hypothetical protein